MRNNKDSEYYQEYVPELGAKEYLDFNEAIRQVNLIKDHLDKLEDRKLAEIITSQWVKQYKQPTNAIWKEFVKSNYTIWQNLKSRLCCFLCAYVMLRLSRYKHRISIPAGKSSQHF